MFVYDFMFVPFIYLIGLKEKIKLKKGVPHDLGIYDSWGSLHRVKREKENE